MKHNKGDIITYKQMARGVNFDYDVIIPYRGKTKKVGLYGYNKEAGYWVVLAGYHHMLSADEYCFIPPQSENKIQLDYYHTGNDKPYKTLVGHFIYEDTYQDKHGWPRQIVRFKLLEDCSLDSAAL